MTEKKIVEIYRQPKFVDLGEAVFNVRDIYAIYKDNDVEFYGHIFNKKERPYGYSINVYFKREINTPFEYDSFEVFFENKESRDKAYDKLAKAMLDLNEEEPPKIKILNPEELEDESSNDTE